LKHNLDNITSQKWGARHIGEPHDHKSGGLEPLGPIGVYAYDNLITNSGKTLASRLCAVAQLVSEQDV